MMTDDDLAKLIVELSMDVETGLRMAETMLVGDQSFEEFGRIATETGYHGCCGASWTSNTLTWRCSDCMKGSTSCFCTDCFMKGNHAGHNVCVYQGCNGVCDCGDENAADKSAFCPDHKGTLCNPKETLPAGIADRFSGVLGAVASFIADIFPEEPYIACFEWLLNIAKWGDGYQRLVVDALVDGNLFQILKKCEEKGDFMNGIYDFLLQIITDMKMKKFFSKMIEDQRKPYMDAMISTLRTGSPMSRYHMELGQLGIQVFTRLEISLKMYIEDEFLVGLLQGVQQVIEEILKKEWYQGEMQKALQVYEQIGSMISNGAEGLRYCYVAQQVMYRADKMNAFYNLLLVIQKGLKMKRKSDGDRVEYDTYQQHIVVLILGLLNDVMTQVSNGFKSIAQLEPTSDTRVKDLQEPLTDEQRERIMNILRDIHCRYTTYDQRESPEMNTLQDMWSIALPFDHLAMTLLIDAIDFYKFDTKEIMSALGITSFWMYAKRSMTFIAGSNYVMTGAFVRNGNGILQAVAHELLSDQYWSTLPRAFQALHLCRRYDRDPSIFVNRALEAWGLSGWIFSEGIEEPNIELSDAICMFSRFLVQCMSNYISEKEIEKQYIMKMNVIHQLKMGTVSSDEIPMKYHVFGQNASAYHDVLHEVGVPFDVDGKRKYKLNDDFDSEVTPFWIGLTLRDFFNMISQMNTKSKNLIPVPDTADDDGKDANRFACTFDFAEMLTTMLRLMTQNLDKFSDTVFLCVLAVIHMSVSVAQQLGDNSTIESILESGVLKGLEGKKDLHKAANDLFGIILSAFPEFEEHIRDHRQTFKVEEPVARKRPDRKGIMAQFTQNNAHFEALQDFSEEEEHDDQVELCVCCREPLNHETNVCGLFWDGTSIDVCPHYVHYSCWSKLGYKVCQVCEYLRQVFVPRFHDGDCSQHITIMQEHMEKQTVSPEIFPQIVKHAAINMQMNETYEVKPALAHLIRGLCETMTMRGQDEPDEPVLKLAYCMLQCSTEDNLTHEKYADVLRESGVTLENENLARVIWNSIIVSKGFTASAQLPLVPCVITDNTLQILDQLPHRFSDLFSNMTPEEKEIMRTKSGHLFSHNGIAKCLHCGAIVREAAGLSKSMQEHHAETKHSVYMSLTGSWATAIIGFSTHIGMPHLSNSVYTTEHGDEDRGLRIGKPLFLSQAKVKEIRQNFYSGIYERVEQGELVNYLAGQMRNGL